MLSLPQQTIGKIKKLLLRQQLQVDKQITGLENDDPVMIQSADEVAEPGTESWKADVHARAVAVKNDLVNLSKKIKDSLLRLNKGTYGRCELCKKTIEVERLEAMPMTNLCYSCSQNGKKKKA